MFDKLGVGGGEYKMGQWRKIAVHDDSNIKGFFGDYRWLSNMWPCEIEYEGLKYPSTENAYQAAKLVEADRVHLTTCTPYESKLRWKKFRLLDNESGAWDARKRRIMLRVSLVKYNNNIDLRKNLLETGEKYLEETNWWHDYFWGASVTGSGQNNLGKVLMDVREFFKNRK